MIDVNGISYENYREYFLLELCGLCGCTDSELEIDILHVFQLYAETKPGESLYYDKIFSTEPRKYVELILHILTKANLLEHGTSVRGSWITKKGKEVAKQLWPKAP